RSSWARAFSEIEHTAIPIARIMALIIFSSPPVTYPNAPRMCAAPLWSEAKQPPQIQRRSRSSPTVDSISPLSGGLERSSPRTLLQDRKFRYFIISTMIMHETHVLYLAQVQR